MNQENTVLCVSNSYNKKYYFNDDFDILPEEIKNELKIMSVLFTEDIGGILEVGFNKEDSLYLQVRTEDTDFLFDEIGCELKIKELRAEKSGLFSSLENFYRIFKEL